MMNTKEFFVAFRYWYEGAKRSKKWSEYQWYDGRLRGMNEMAYHIGLISFNTWELLETLIQELEEINIDKGLD